MFLRSKLAIGGLGQLTRMITNPLTGISRPSSATIWSTRRFREATDSKQQLAVENDVYSTSAEVTSRSFAWFWRDAGPKRIITSEVVIQPPMKVVRVLAETPLKRRSEQRL